MAFEHYLTSEKKRKEKKKKVAMQYSWKVSLVSFSLFFLLFVCFFLPFCSWFVVAVVVAVFLVF